MFLLTLFLTLNTVFQVNSETYYGDPCKVTDIASHSSTDVKHDVINLTILKDCTNGSIYWNYPRGTAILSASRPGTEFDLCIESSWATRLSEVKVQTGTASGQLQVPTEGNPACIHSVHGEAALNLIAPQALLYLTIMDYSIVPIESA
ncbi:hypothetical protein Btru_042348 [Bulinus truncatus]|nr:hypothetical protein Btru_042348 [Bulinus truncatus]